MDLGILQLAPTEGDLVFPFNFVNTYSYFQDYWGLELETNLGMYTDHTFDISNWISTERPPSGRNRFVLLRDFRCEWSSAVELADSNIIQAHIQLHFRLRDPSNDSSVSAKSPILGPSFRIGNHISANAIEKSILLLISQIVTPVIKQVASQFSLDNVRSSFWEKLRIDLPKVLQNHRWLGFYGGNSIPENISFRSLSSERFVEPKILLKLYEKPVNVKAALLGKEPLNEIPIKMDQDQFFVQTGQVLKIYFQFRSKTFIEIIHLEPVFDYTGELQEYRYPKYQQEKLHRYKWNLLLSEIGIPWSKTRDTNLFGNVFEKDPKYVIFPENLVGPSDPEGLMFTSNFGYEAIFIIASSVKLPKNWLNYSEIEFDSWKHTEESKMGQLPVAHLVKCLRSMVPRGAHIYNYVFKNS